MCGCDVARWACAALVLLGRVASAGEVRPLVVPPPLAARNATLEVSGIVWAAPLQRYLVVSDDTGKGKENHAPWVFAVSKDGAFDVEPLVIAGVKSLNDAEALCAGPDGTFFLTTSHSPNKKGKTKDPRRQLLWLALEGRGLRVLGQVDLGTARTAKGGDFLEIVSGGSALPAGAFLDIEGLAFRDGSLWIGLKSPQTAQGHAVLLRFDAPTEALRRGAIPDGAVVRAKTFPLAGAEVAQGIADLFFLPDGGLLLAANAPKGGPEDGGGALYLLRAGAQAPQLLERFKGLKPEGVTLAHDGASLVVAFDNGTGAPSWTNVPLPK